jgi:hypothetical protein
MRDKIELSELAMLQTNRLQDWFADLMHPALAANMTEEQVVEVCVHFTYLCLCGTFSPGLRNNPMLLATLGVARNLAVYPDSPVATEMRRTLGTTDSEDFR